MASPLSEKDDQGSKPRRERAEIRRRAELIAATIITIGEEGSLDITVGQIARAAGTSPALAFHYFGDKESLFLAAMRHVLRVFASEVLTGLRLADTPRDRAAAILLAGFSPANFHRGSIAAWLNFYVLAQKSDKAHRLLRLYRRRLTSNLRHALRPALGDRAPGAAERMSGLIDGLYLHAALEPRTGAASARHHLLTALDQELETPRG